MERLASTLPLLKQIRLLENPCITHRGVASLCESCLELEALAIEGTGFVCSLPNDVEHRLQLDLSI